MNEKILVIHQGALGDLVLNFPALESLKYEKNAFVTILCSSQLGRIAHELNVVDAYFSLESARFCSLFCEEITPAAKEFINDYNRLILFSFSSAIEGYLRQNHGGNVHKISPRPPIDEETHVALYIIEQLVAKGLLNNCGMRSRCEMSWRRLHFVSSCQAQPSAESKIQNRNSIKRNLHKKNSIIIHPGAGSPRKRWPVENFVQVASIIKGMNHGDVVFVVGPAESDLALFIKAEIKEDFQVREGCDLSILIALLRQARCFVGNDSGVTHLAAFMGIPTVAIFGPSSPRRWFPVGPATTVLRGLVDCVPCFEKDAVNCKGPQCLSGVSVDMVLDAVKKIIP